MSEQVGKKVGLARCLGRWYESLTDSALLLRHGLGGPGPPHTFSSFDTPWPSDPFCHSSRTCRHSHLGLTSSSRTLLGSPVLATVVACATTMGSGTIP
jgi:hypothetical protein